MPERLKGRDWKSRECPKGVPRVRIPLSPPPDPLLPLTFALIPIVRIVIGQIERTTFPGDPLLVVTNGTGPVIPVVRYGPERECGVGQTTHESVPSSSLRSCFLVHRIVFPESLRIVPHPVITGRIIADEAGIIIPRRVGILTGREKQETHSNQQKYVAYCAHSFFIRSRRLVPGI